MDEKLAAAEPGERVEVALGARSYPILIGGGLLARLGEIMRSAGLRTTAALVVCDDHTGPLFFETARTSLGVAGFAQIIEHRIPAGETGKTWAEYSRCCDALLRHFPDTGVVPAVVALGGGVVGDLAGFAAATFRRGVPYVQVPTTLLSAVDSSVGGKTGVNHGEVKNIMGAIYQPRLVVTDLALLGTLPPREIRSGLAEVIKYGAVCQRALFEDLEKNLSALLALEGRPLQRVVAECCRIKAAVVREDESDTGGVRIVLNFGHTVGHALEMAAHGALTHGEAIAVGMMAAGRLAELLGMVSEDFLPRLEALLRAAELPVTAPPEIDGVERVLRIMQSDKKFQHGKNRFVLPTEIGGWRAVEDIEMRIVEEAVKSVLREPASTDSIAS